MLNLKNKTESPIDKENKLVAARGEKGGEAGKMGEEDVMYSIGNTVNNIIITLYGARWLLNLLW